MGVVYVRPGEKGFAYGPNGERRYTRSYWIKCDNVAIDRAAILMSGAVPFYGVPHPEDFTATCSTCQLDQNKENPLLWYGTWTWTTLHSGSDQEKQKDPPDRRPRWRWSFVPVPRDWPCDLNGKAFVDSAGTPFAPPPKMPVWARQITVIRWEPVSFQSLQLDTQYQYATNTDAWLFYKPGECLVESISREDVFEQNKWWFHATYVLLCNPFIALPNSSDKFGGFDPELVVDAGPKILDGNNKPIPIQDAGYVDGQPRLLDGRGKVLPAGQPPKFLKFRTKNRAVFRSLNLVPPY